MVSKVDVKDVFVHVLSGMRFHIALSHVFIFALYKLKKT